MRFSGKYDSLMEQTMFRYQNQGFLCGDYVKIKKDALKHEKVSQMSPQMKAMIEAAIKGETNLRVSYIKSVAAEAMSGPVNAANIPGCLWADVVFEYAPGMWKDPMTLPIEILEKVDIENEMEGYAPYSKSLVRPNNEILKPIEVQNTNNREKNISPEHNLTDKNMKLAHTKNPKSGLDDVDKPKKLKESVETRFGWNKDIDMLSEAYKQMHTEAAEFEGEYYFFTVPYTGGGHPEGLEALKYVGKGTVDSISYDHGSLEDPRDYDEDMMSTTPKGIIYYGEDKLNIMIPTKYKVNKETLNKLRQIDIEIVTDIGSAIDSIVV